MPVAAADLQPELARGLEAMDLTVSQASTGKLAAYLELLAKWNRAYNLTAVRDPLDMVGRHVLDSLTLLPFLRGKSVLDVGTGAGLPGVPLAIVDTTRELTLLDSAGKKMRFLRHAVTELGLGNVTLEQCRVENYRPDEPFDTVVSRAFSDLRDFVTHCADLVADNGQMLAMKGRYPEAELGGLPAAWSAETIAPVSVPDMDAHRHIVVLTRK